MNTIKLEMATDFPVHELRLFVQLHGYVMINDNGVTKIIKPSSARIPVNNTNKNVVVPFSKPNARTGFIPNTTPPTSAA